MSGAPAIETSNYAKYQTRNPVVRRLIGGFYAELRSLVESLEFGSLLDAGCGEGEALERLGDLLPSRSVGVDISDACVTFAGRRLPTVDVRRASVLELPFEDASFDLVLCLEVLEHLEEPGVALAELARVSARHLIVSVPHEPRFRLGNLMRGRHIRRLGNHPEHLQQFTKSSFEKFLATQVEPLEVRTPLPWLLARCRVPQAA